MKIVIKGFIQTSMLDWEGKIVSTLYVPSCNFRCPFCQNSVLVLNSDSLEEIEIESIMKYLTSRKGWVDGVCITGGEPCMYEDLSDFIKKVRKTGMLVKLDTNGAYPQAIKKLMQDKLMDYIAIDIKAPLDMEHYANSAGIRNENTLHNVKESIRIVMESGMDYEFRTTVVPCLHTAEDIKKIASFIKGAKKYALQNFKPQDTIDESYMNVKPYTPDELRKIGNAVSGFVEKCIVRGI